MTSALDFGSILMSTCFHMLFAFMLLADAFIQSDLQKQFVKEPTMLSRFIGQLD